MRLAKDVDWKRAVSFLEINYHTLNLSTLNECKSSTNQGFHKGKT